MLGPDRTSLICQLISTQLTTSIDPIVDKSYKKRGEKYQGHFWAVHSQFGQLLPILRYRDENPKSSSRYSSLCYGITWKIHTSPVRDHSCNLGPVALAPNPVL
uniref:Uncharacterized protein n=1 Tax=Cacopsylla melanoneura TaxID=428564 RepID=A0A8D8ZCY3_9HEMI